MPQDQLIPVIINLCDVKANQDNIKHIWRRISAKKNRGEDRKDIIAKKLEANREDRRKMSDE